MSSNTQRRIAPILALLLILTACADPTLKKIAQAELDVANGVTAAQDTVEQLYSQQSITADDARAVSSILLKITVANENASTITKNLAKLDPTNRTALQSIIIPLIQAVNDGITQGVVPIQNQTAKTSIMASLTAVVTALNIIQSSLAAPVQTGATQ